MRAPPALALALALAACQIGGAGGTGPGGAADPLAGYVVDDLLPGADAAGTGEGEARRSAAAEPPPERPRAAAAGEAPAGGDGAAPADAETPPERDVFAAARAACEAEGGTFGRAPGGGEARICFRTPDDANAPCRTGADCAGACLARSRTCAPVVPLMGCHEVILSNGIRATECLQ